MKMPTAFHRPAWRRVPRIELDTPIVPRAVAEGVCEEAGLWLGQPLPRRWVRELTARANTIYAHNPRFRRKIRAQGAKSLFGNYEGRCFRRKGRMARRDEGEYPWRIFD